MEILGTILTSLGAILALVTSIWLLVVAFRKHILWGIACLFIPFAAFAFAAWNWDIAAKPFLLSILAGIVIMVGLFVSPSFQKSLQEPKSVQQTQHP